MKNIVKKLYYYFNMIGIDFRKTYYLFKFTPFLVIDYIRLRKQKNVNSETGSFSFGKFYPVFTDKNAASGQAKGHYFHQDLLIARRIYNNKPGKHVDIGSRVDGFVAHVAVFREIEIVDIRKLNSNVDNISYMQSDLMLALDKKYYNYCDSLSCLHVLEHFGLGRYGDDIDYYGYLKGFANLSHMLQKGGKLYISVPIGPQRIEFNAHRVFSVKYLVNLIQNEYRIDRFSYVDDRGDLFDNVSLDKNVHNNFGCIYGCGIFELTKL